MRLFRFQSVAQLLILLVLAGFVATVSAPPTHAQQVTSAAIHGSVTDTTGAVVPNAKVTALNTATGISTVTNSNNSGLYTLPTLQIGPYTVDVEAIGFQRSEAKGITLTANADLEINARLKVGTTAETITVDASSAQVETANTQLQQTITDSVIENIPLLGRDAASLQKLAPGVVESSDRFGGYSSNGSQTTSNSYLLDGIDNNDGPLQDEGLIINPDALAEENIITSTLNPEFSRNGGAVVNQVLKSGTNKIHGSGFEYYRDTFMNNGNYFTPAGAGHPPFHQNLYGGTLGGPILRDKLFLFGAYQGFRNRTGTTTETHVFPTGYVSQGDFGSQTVKGNAIPFDITTPSGACGPTSAKTTWAACFPAGSSVVIAPSNFNSLATALANKYVPAANAGPFYNFVTANTGAADQGILRADYHISNSDSIYGTGIFQSSPSAASLGFGGSNLPGFSTIQAEHFKLFSASETHTFNSNNLNELRVGYFRFNFATVEPAQVVSPASVGFDITPNNSSSGVPYMNVQGLFSLGFSHEGPQPRKDTNLTAGDNFTRIFHNHTIKIGTSVEQFRVNNPYSADNNGNYQFAGSGTYSSGVPAIDFLLGIPDTYQQTSGGFTDTIAYEFYTFAQDSWKATSDLTVNYGLAWDVETPNRNMQFKGEGITCFQVGGPVSTVFPGGFPGLLFPGDPGCNTAGSAKIKYNHFGPRIGFAWSPSRGPAALIGESGAHKLSVRAGFGMYFNRDQEEGQLQNLGDTPNFKNSFGAADFGGSPGFVNPFADVAGNGSEASPFPYSPPKPGSALDWTQYVEQDTSAIDPNYTVPYIYNWNLNLQRQLSNTMILQIGYVGSVGHKLATTHEGDPITPAGHATCLASSACTAALPALHLEHPELFVQPTTFAGAPAYLSIGELSTTGSSNYNALQVSLNKNLSHGLYATVAYTYSHGLDNASGLESSGFNGPGTNFVPGFTHLSYGSSDYDARHRFVAAYDYGVPLLASMNQQPVVKEILGSWHVAGFTVLQTGFPVDISDPGTFNSGYCDQYSYYSCPDVPNTTSFHIKKQDIRKTYRQSGGMVASYLDTSPFYQEGTTPENPNIVSNPGTFGNVGRGLVHGPGFNYTDLSLYKNIPLGGEGARSLQIMLQAANVFNHANFDQPDGNFTDGALFGTVSAVKSSNASFSDYNGDPYGGRTAQLVAKIRF
ncbi:MAG: carboxypeptidase-like regulatory domain-containing protein [Terracidiphilus sp.]